MPAQSRGISIRRDTDRSCAIAAVSLMLCSADAGARTLPTCATSSCASSRQKMTPWPAAICSCCSSSADGGRKPPAGIAGASCCCKELRCGVQAHCGAAMCWERASGARRQTVGRRCGACRVCWAGRRPCCSLLTCYKRCLRAGGCVRSFNTL